MEQTENARPNEVFDVIEERGYCTTDEIRQGAGDIKDCINADEESAEGIKWSVNALTAFCHGNAFANGWWHDLETGAVIERNAGEQMMLMVTELAEAFEGVRKNKQDDHLPHRSSLEVEFADTIIRICDMAGSLSLDLGGAIIEKLRYNNTRADHKREARLAPDGKKV